MTYRPNPRLSRRAALAAALVALAVQPMARAQDAPAAPTPPGPSAPAAPAAPSTPVPAPKPAEAAPAPDPARTLSAQAAFSANQGSIRSGLEWRVFKVMPDSSVTIVARSEDAAPSFRLLPGAYVVHASYGYATAFKKVSVADAPVSVALTLAAGALRLASTVADQPIARAKVTYTIYVPAPGDPESRELAGDIRSGDVVRLAEGVYHIVSLYGDTNATVRADLKVESGKLTDATLRQRAATVTLKLVEAAGGEALADTSWSVLSPGGDIVQELVGAFAVMTLAEGFYSVVARHSGKTYSRDFKVETGRDGDVEILAKDSQ